MNVKTFDYVGDFLQFIYAKQSTLLKRKAKI